MSLKDHMADTGGDRVSLSPELTEACLEAQEKLKQWIQVSTTLPWPTLVNSNSSEPTCSLMPPPLFFMQRPDLAANDHLLFELLHWNDEVNAAVGSAGLSRRSEVDMVAALPAPVEAESDEDPLAH